MGWRDAPIVEPGWKSAPVVGQETPEAAPAPEAAPLVQGEEGSWLEDLWRWGTLGAQGFNQGLTNMVEMPYDALNNAPRLGNLLPGVDGIGKISEMARGVPVLGDMFQTDDPYMGMADQVGFTNVIEPKTAYEKIFERGFEEVGASVLPGMAVAKRAGTLAKEGKHAYDMGLLDQSFVAPFINSPGKTAAAEGTAAFGAGVGAQTANNATGGNPLAEFGGAVLGGALAPFGGGVIRSGGEAWKAVRGGESFAEGEVGRRLVEEASDPSVLEMPRLQALVDQANEAGINPTVGQATDDPGLKNLEYSRLTGPTSGRFSERRSEQSNTLKRGIEDTAPVDATDDAFLETLQTLDDDRMARFSEEQQQAIEDAAMWYREGELSAQEAQAMIDDAIGGLPADPAIARETASSQAADRVFGDAEDSVLSRERARRNELYDAVPDDVEVPTAASREAAIAELDQLGRAGNAQPSIARIAEDEAETIPLGRARKDLTTLGDDAQASRRAGRPGDARVLDNVRQGVRQDLESAGEANDALRAANQNDSENYAPRFREGVPADVRAGKVTNDKYLGKALKDPVEADRLAMTIEGDEAAQTAVRDWLIADLGSGGAENMTPARADKWLRDNGAVLERFPEVRDEVQRLRNKLASGGDEMARAQEVIDGAKKLNADAEKMKPDAPDEFAEKYRSAETGDARMKKVLNAPKSRVMLRQLVESADEESLPGLKRGFVDLMMRGSDGSGGIVSRSDGQINPDAAKRFLERYGDHIDILYRDAPDHAKDIKTMLESVAIMNRVGASKPRGTTGTGLSARAEIGGVPVTSVLSRLYAAESGRTSYRYVISEGLGQILARLRAKTGGEAMGRILDEALLNPEYASILAGKYSKELDRKATKTLGAILARTSARAGRAGVLSDGEDEDEPLRIEVRPNPE